MEVSRLRFWFWIVLCFCVCVRVRICKGMGLTFGLLFQSMLLICNAMAVLNEERFLNHGEVDFGLEPYS